MLRLGAGWDALTAGRCLQWWEGCKGPWAWEHSLSHFGMPLHRKTGFHVERLDSAKVAQVLEGKDGVHNHINYSHCNII